MGDAHRLYLMDTHGLVAGDESTPEDLSPVILPHNEQASPVAMSLLIAAYRLRRR